ncbi:hypothetical protein FCU94_07660 [Vibrio sp. JPW-9-11-11]|uniref:hypothetical protein n=1 Tax=Vibrio sp. JPW-9-11-11 TaxID=1416532 RepID=UPI0015947D50|nr:hypothetical protein [Vibrio sp. JPW-9-11-11]NVD06788.1 hypothetical protein [Vibrio sp. JPW-9-11-11]
MDASHKTAYSELQSMYNELKNYLDSVMLEPEDEQLLRKCEHLGDKIYTYNAAILENNSRMYEAEQGCIKELIQQAKGAQEMLKSSEDKVKVVAQVANALDKIFQHLGKFL